MKPEFTHFVGIDWSGAKGSRHAGLAVAICEAGENAPTIVSPPSGRKSWSRSECADWIDAGMGLPEGARALVGIDSAFSMPFIDKGGYIPGAATAETTPDLWHTLDAICREATDLYGGPFVDAHSDFYLRAGDKGKRFERRMRVCEQWAIDGGAGPCESVFHLIGPSQVGLSGLSTMRMLNRLAGSEHIAIWPYETAETRATVLVEIYAAAFAKMGGHRGKMRGIDDLNSTLINLKSGPLAGMPETARAGEHAADALVTSAGLRMIAGDHKYWHPPALSTMVRRTEGWIFGVM